MCMCMRLYLWKKEKEIEWRELGGGGAKGGREKVEKCCVGARVGSLESLVICCWLSDVSLDCCVLHVLIFRSRNACIGESLE